MAFGVESGKIPNSQITSSTAYHPRVAAVQGRLNGAASWSARVRNKNQWIQIDLGRDEVVTAIATQGRANLNQWVTSYYVSYSLDGKVFISYKNDGIIKASTNCGRYIKRVSYIQDTTFNCCSSSRVTITVKQGLLITQQIFKRNLTRLSNKKTD